MCEFWRNCYRYLPIYNLCADSWRCHCRGLRTEAGWGKLSLVGRRPHQPAIRVSLVVQRIYQKYGDWWLLLISLRRPAFDEANTTCTSPSSAGIARHCPVTGGWYKLWWIFWPSDLYLWHWSGSDNILFSQIKICFLISCFLLTLCAGLEVCLLYHLLCHFNLQNAFSKLPDLCRAVLHYKVILQMPVT